VTEARDNPWSEGDVVAGRYRLIERIGAGAMGEVWSAEHVLTRRPVAVKALVGSVAPGSPAFRRFEQEARTAGLIGHPAVVEILDAFVTGGVPVLVMELCEGETLAHRLAHGAVLSTVEVARLFLPIVEALSVAHRKGIVHRDLKPENLYLCRDPGGAIRPRILDFGLAKLLDPGAMEAAVVTRGGVVVGTPSYMSPEQASGSTNIDGRADVWSLGVILYRALSGVLPIEGHTASDVVARLLHDAITPLEVLAPDVPAALAGVVTRMLDRDPSGRPDLAEVAAVLRALGESAPAPLAAAPTRPARKKRAWAMAAGAIAVLVGAGAVVYYVGVGESSTKPPGGSKGTSLPPWMIDSIGSAGLMTRWARYDSKGVEPRRFALDTLAIVREQAADAELIHVTAFRVDRRGLVDLTAAGKVVIAVRAPSRRLCLYAALDEHPASGGKSVGVTPLERCPKAVGRQPRCGAPELVPRAARAGFPWRSLMYPSPTNAAGWMIDGPNMLLNHVPDDCR
jgi:eukaryotic-like serine/threonine-protein kinase